MLKSFATASRTNLIEQMRAQVRQLLADPKAEAEYSRELKALRAEVDAHGEAWVADTAAYTWFNRLTAARYMDANGFSGMYGVVSPEAGSASTLPEILTRAHAGDFPEEVTADVQSAVTDVLTGRRVSANPDAEAYGLLLGAMFRTWHQPIPEVFPAAVDWIRLLTPVDILAPTSVRVRAVEVMDAEACENVEVVGWLYQFYNAELKEQINWSKAPIAAAELAPVTQLFTPHWIVRYLVENSLGQLWLRSRPSSQLRSKMDYYVEPAAGQEGAGVTVDSPKEIRVLDPACGSGHMLTYAFDLLYAIYEEEGYTPNSIPELILTHNLRGLEIDKRAAQLASFTLAMKARGRDRRFLARKVQPDIVWVQPVSFNDDEVKAIVEVAIRTHSGDVACAEALTRLLHTFTDADTFGSLIRIDADAMKTLGRAIDGLERAATDLFAAYNADLLRTLWHQARVLVDNQYQVVVANPPYLGRKHMAEMLKGFAAEHYPLSQFDSYAMFIERALEFAGAGGSVGMVTMHGWMFLSSYDELRRRVLRSATVRSLAHFGPHAFEAISGEVVQTVAFVFDHVPPTGEVGTYFRLTTETTSEEKADALLAAVHDPSHPLKFFADEQSFEQLPDSILSYWISAAARRIFARSVALSDRGEIGKGMATGNNDYHLREWFEVNRSETGMAGEDSGRWIPYNKGGRYRKWWGNRGVVIDWRINEPAKKRASRFARITRSDLYFRDAVTWGTVTPGTINSRLLPADSVSDDGGSIFIPTNGWSLYEALGLLNSSTVDLYLESLAPTINNQPGYVGKLPHLESDHNDVEVIVKELVSVFRADSDDYETSWDFGVNPLVAMGEGLLETRAKIRWDNAIATTKQVQELEEANNRYFAGLYELEDEVECEVPASRISLTQNPYFRYTATKGATRTEDQYQTLFFRDMAKELISYAVGCMVGRYSLDKTGLVLADGGLTIADYDQKVPSARFRPDLDGILPITVGRYFEDDIVTRLREFLSVALDAEDVEANVSWLEHALGSGKRKSLRDYFISDFYADHVKTYSKRPIYWQVSSPKGGFNALFYLHRYTPATLGLIHQNYAEELLDKMQARLNIIEHALPSAGKREAMQLAKERDQLTAQRREIRDWIDDKLFPLASAEIPLNLDDGVKQNYPKLAGVVKKVNGL